MQIFGELPIQAHVFLVLEFNENFSKVKKKETNSEEEEEIKITFPLMAVETCLEQESWVAVINQESSSH